MRLSLTRLYSSGVQTRGILTLRGDTGEELFKCYSLERGTGPNERGSNNRIAEGSYSVWGRKADESPSRSYRHFMLRNEDTAPRKWVLIHRGNVYSHSAGCILVGEGLGHVNDDGLMDITDSTQALANLCAVCWDRARREDIPLKITDLSGTYQRALEDHRKIDPLPPVSLPLSEHAQLPDLWEIDEAERKLSHFG